MYVRISIYIKLSFYVSCIIIVLYTVLKYKARLKCRLELSLYKIVYRDI